VTVMNERKVKIDQNFAARCERLHNEVAAKLEGGGECTAEEAERLLEFISRLRSSIRIECPAEPDETPRVELGSELSVWHFEGDYFVRGFVVACESGGAKVLVPQRIIPARAEQIIPGYIFEAQWDDNHELWIDWSAEEETDK
jgi:hypothetical protein